MPTIESVMQGLKEKPRSWLVTGAAGFIGSHLTEALLHLDQHVLGLDNFSTGHQSNLDAVLANASTDKAARFSFIEGDIRDLATCQSACKNIDYVLHEAALGSVPRSLEDPILTHESNINGFLNLLVTARDSGVKRVVYAASSSTYGDHPALPKLEDNIGRPLSPYAVTKYVNELYADVFAKCYGLSTIGLRYFNVFGPRQDPNGAYAAVIPRWINNLCNGTACRINGDGETSRDFCYIDNTVQANILAAVTDNKEAVNQIYNVAVGERTSLNQLFYKMRDFLAAHDANIATIEPQYGDFRAGDVRHSQADVSKAQALLGYEPTVDVVRGLELTCNWFMDSSTK